MSVLRTLPLLAALLVVACGGDDTATASTAPTSAPALDSQPPAIPDAVEPAGAAAPAPGTLPDALEFTRPWFGDLDAMVERRIIRVLTVYGPGRYYLSEGPKGFTAEYAQELQKAVNTAYDTGLRSVQVFVVPVARDQLFPALLAGRGDIVMAGTTITEARQEAVTFTKALIRDVDEILVTGPSAPAIATLDDLAGRAVYVRASSSYADSVRVLNARLAERGLDPVVIEPASEFLEDEDLIEMVNSGLLPWAIVDAHKTQMWEGVFDNLVIRADLVFRRGGRLAWAIRNDSPQLLDFLNRFIPEHRQGTLFGNIMLNRYLRDFDWATNALGYTELQRYRTLSGLFQRHGEDYGIDPALLAAQGYQESRLDQSKRSHRGAIGVMQLLRSTAADKNVGIPNIEELDPNIEAGAKYMAFLHQRYFSGPDIDELNGSLLALAAYNAGPGRIRKLRSEAEARGYDPNVWFDNVEVIAAERIGRETVQYVANIFKYYLTYQMINRQTVLHRAARESMGIEPG